MWAELGRLNSAATTQPANVNKLPKMDSLLAKIAFMSKVLDSRSNDLQRFRKYKEGQKIPQKISTKMAIERWRFMSSTVLLWLACTRGKHPVQKLIVISNKFPRTFDSIFLSYVIDAYWKCLKKWNWTDSFWVEFWVF